MLYENSPILHSCSAFCTIKANNYRVFLTANPENTRFNLKIELGGEAEPVLITQHMIKSQEFARLKDAYPKIREFLIEE